MCSVSHLLPSITHSFVFSPARNLLTLRMKKYADLRPNPLEKLCEPDQSVIVEENSTAMGKVTALADFALHREASHDGASCIR